MSVQLENDHLSLILACFLFLYFQPRVFSFTSPLFSLLIFFQLHFFWQVMAPINPFEVGIYGTSRPGASAFRSGTTNKQENALSPILNKISREITQNPHRGASQAMLIGAGLSLEDLNKPQVGISSVWWEGNTCNMHLLEFGKMVKESCKNVNLVRLQ